MMVASRANVWPYIGIYFVTTIALYLVWYFYAYSMIVPSEKSGVAANILIPFISTSLSYSIFINRNRRVFTNAEYWLVVILTTVFKIIFTTAYFIYIVAVTGLTNISVFYDRIWISVALIGAVVIFLMNAAGFSIWIGKILLKLQRIKRTQPETDPSQ